MTTGKTAVEEELHLRALYDAACRAELNSVYGRTFEEWRDKVSDYGLAAARNALEARIDTERIRLEREVIQAVKFWNHAQGEATHVTEVDGTVLTVVRAWNKLRAAVTALESFEANQK